MISIMDLICSRSGSRKLKIKIKIQEIVVSETKISTFTLSCDLHKILLCDKNSQFIEFIVLMRIKNNIYEQNKLSVNALI